MDEKPFEVQVFKPPTMAVVRVDFLNAVIDFVIHSKPSFHRTPRDAIQSKGA
jgi:hypothetical protein